MGISPGCYENEPICICLVPSRLQSLGEIWFNSWGKRGRREFLPITPRSCSTLIPSSLSCASHLSRVLTNSPIPTYTWKSQWRRKYLLGKYRIGFVTISLKNNILKYSHRGSRDVWLLHMWIPLLNLHPLELLACLWVLIQTFEFLAMIRAWTLQFKVIIFLITND